MKTFLKYFNWDRSETSKPKVLDTTYLISQSQRKTCRIMTSKNYGTNLCCPLHIRCKWVIFNTHSDDGVVLRFVFILSIGIEYLHRKSLCLFTWFQGISILRKKRRIVLSEYINNLFWNEFFDTYFNVMNKVLLFIIRNVIFESCVKNDAKNNAIQTPRRRRLAWEPLLPHRWISTLACLILPFRLIFILWRISQVKIEGKKVG